MLVADTSALVTLALGGTLDLALREFDVHTTETVLDELAATGRYDDEPGVAARRVLECRSDLTVHGVESPVFESSRVDEGEGSCATLARGSNADFLLTDDLRALPELRPLAETRVAISPIVLRALVERDALEREDALDRIELLADRRDRLESPIYRRARTLFEDR